MSTIGEIHAVINNINQVASEKLQTAERNGYLYVEKVETHQTLFNSATTKKNLLSHLYAYLYGLTAKKESHEN